MSAAIAPPIVTCLVPGVTGTKKPRGTICRITVSRLVAPDAVQLRQLGIEVDRAGVGKLDHVAASVEGCIAVRATEAARDHATRSSRT